jgi:hypothetical protein
MMTTALETTVEAVLPNGRTILYDDASHTYADSELGPLDSVTTVLGVLRKDALTWWGMRVGIAGTIGAMLDGSLGEVKGMPLEAFYDSTHPQHDQAKAVCEAHIVRAQRSTNHVRDRAGARGDGAHALFERLSRGEDPDLGALAERDRGYGMGVARFWLDAQPVEPRPEVIVASVELALAGRYDLRCVLPRDTELVVNAKTGKREVFPAGSGLFDLKTGKSVYDEALLQLGAYEGLSVMSGYEHTDFRAVIRACPDGSYEVKRSPATFEMFLGVLGAFRALESLKAAKPRRGRR